MEFSDSTAIWIGAFLGLGMPLAFCVDQLQQWLFVCRKNGELRALLGEYSASKNLNAANSQVDAASLLRQKRVKELPETMHKKSTFAAALLGHHPWLSPIFAGPTSAKTIPQHLISLVLAVCIALAVSAAYFYLNARDESFSVGMWLSAIFWIFVPSSFISFILNRTVARFFTFSPRSPLDASRFARKLCPAEAENPKPQKADESAVEVLNPVRESADFTADLLPEIPESAIATPISDASSPEEKSDARRIKLAKLGLGFLKSNTNSAVHIRGEDLLQVALSLEARGRHLTAISVRAIAVGRKIHTILPDLHLKSYPHFLEALEKVLSAKVERKKSHSGDGPSKPALLLGTVLRQYVDVALTDEIELPPCSTKPSRSNELYGVEMHSVIWRMALECVKAREFVLAEALFTMHLLVENPDLYFVFFHTPPPQKFPEVLVRVLFAAGLPLGANELVNVGRLWGSFYAAFHLGIDAGAYAAAARSCDMPTPDTLMALLGINPFGPATVEFGSVTYSLDLETRKAIPSLAEAVHLCIDPKVNSLVQAAHIFRLAEKPHLDQRWTLTESERVAATISRHGLPNDDARRAISFLNQKLFHHDDRVFIEAPTLHDVVRDSTDDFAGKRISSRNVNCDVRYDPSGNTKSVTFENVPYDLQSGVRLAADGHQNFYATIEFGRLLALFTCLDHKILSMSEFGARYNKECHALYCRCLESGLRFGGEKQWEGCKSQGSRDLKREVHGGNLSHELREASDPVLVTILNGEVGVRYAASKILDRYPLTYLSCLQPPNLTGTGSKYTPHVGIASAVNASYVGDTIILYRGWFQPTILEDCKSVGKSVTIAPLRYREQQFDLNVRLNEEDWAKFEKATLGRNRVTEPVLTLRNCHGINFNGIMFTEAPVGVLNENSQNCLVRHCKMDCDLACFTKTEDSVPLELNEMDCTPPEERDNPRDLYWKKLKNTDQFRQYPWWYIIYGYIVAYGVIGVSLLAQNLLTQNFSEDCARRWLYASLCVVTLEALFVSVIAVAKQRNRQNRTAIETHLKKFY